MAAHCERFPEQQRQIQEMGLFLVEEQVTGFIHKLQSQGVLPQGVRVDISVAPEKNPIYTHPEFTFYRDQNRVERGGVSHVYTKMEGKILDVFVSCPNAVIKSDMLLKKIWGYEDPIGSSLSLVKGHILHIRKGLEEIGIEDSSSVILTRHGAGYELIDSSRKQSANHSSSFTINAEQPQTDEGPKIFNHTLFNFDAGRHLLIVDGEFVHLSKVESEMLDMLAINVNRIVDFGYLMETLRYGIDDSDVELLRTHISHIRNKIINGREIKDPIIGSAWGVGYILLDYSRMLPDEAEGMKKMYNKGRRSTTR